MPDTGQEKKHDTQMTREEIEKEMEDLRKMFSLVRLLDMETLKQQPCYAPWKDEKPCRNCIGREVLKSKGKKSKLEYLGADIYQATARYVEGSSRCKFSIMASSMALRSSV